MSTAMDRERVLSVVREELPRLLREDDEVRAAVALVYSRARNPDYESRFDRILNELKTDRQEQARRWEQESARWKANDLRFHEVHEEIMALNRRLESSITAIGARWGLRSGSAYRNGLRAVLEESFGVKVESIIEFDD